jgi:hypothetical protein
MVYFFIIFIIGLLAYLLFVRKEKGTFISNIATERNTALPAKKIIKTNYKNDEVYLDYEGKEFKLVEKIKTTPRKTYLQGNIKGKYWGEIDQTVQDEFERTIFYDFNIYEAEIFNTELSTVPFEVESDIKFPRERLPAQLSVTLKSKEDEYVISIHEPVIGDAKVIRRLHQTDGNEVYGTIEAIIVGYIFDKVEEYCIEPEYLEVSEEKPIIKKHVLYKTNIPTGNVEYRSNYSRKEYFYSDFENKYWGTPVYHQSLQRGSSEGLLSFFLWGAGGIIFLLFLILLLPKLGVILPFLLIPILFRIIPKIILNWILRGVAGLLICCFVFSLINQFINGGKRYIPKPVVQDTSRETKPEYEPIIDTIDGNLINDTLITHFRSWKDYEGNIYEGKFWVRSNDFSSSHFFKENLSIPQKTEHNYDQIIYTLKNNDTSKLAGLYQLFDSLKTIHGLSEKAFAEIIVSFVQDIPYAVVLPNSCNANEYSDEFVRNYLSNKDAKCDGFQKFGINTPVEFLASLQGDCDTRTLLIYTVLSHYSFDVALLSSEYYNHSIIGINLPYEGIAFTYDTRRYIMWETTAPDIKPGILPKEISNINYWRISLKSK